MSANNSYQPWSIDDIHRYLEGGMTVDEIATFEADLVSDPFLKDAVDGYAGHARIYVDHHLGQLDQKIGPTKATRPIPIWSIGAAASLLMLVAAWFIFGDVLQNAASSNVLADNKSSKQEEVVSERDLNTLEAAKEDDIAVRSNQFESDSLFGGIVSNETEAAGKSAMPPTSRTQTAVRRNRRRPAKKVGGIVSGVVTDESGQPLIGANVYFPINEAAITTDFNGNFAVELKSYDSIAIVNYSGYESGVFPLGNAGKQTFKLNYSDAELADVAVTSAPIESEPDEDAQNRSALMDMEEQVKTKDLATSEDVQVETKPAQPTKGFKKYERYIKRNLNYPSSARNNNISGVVVLQFKVLPNGDIFDIRILQSLGYGCDEEAIRLIKEGPSWVGEDQKSVRTATYSIEFKKK